MYKTAKFLKDVRLFAYIVVLVYVVETFFSIALDIVNGKTGETLFYKGISFVWATVAFIALKVVYEMWDIVDDIGKDIKELKEKGHHVVSEKLTKPDFSGGINIPLTEEEVQKMLLTDRLFEKKKKKKPPN